jgi:hypothetical protein
MGLYRYFYSFLLVFGAGGGQKGMENNVGQLEILFLRWGLNGTASTGVQPVVIH